MSTWRQTSMHAPIDAAACWPDLARIRTYYDQTQFDYRLLWLNRENRAMHFGYWDAATRTHADSLPASIRTDRMARIPARDPFDENSGANMRRSGTGTSPPCAPAAGLHDRRKL